MVGVADRRGQDLGFKHVIVVDRANFLVKGFFRFIDVMHVMWRLEDRLRRSSPDFTLAVEVLHAIFSMFNYVNHLNEELEKLDISIGEVKNEIEKYRGQDNENNTQRKKILRELETRLARTEARVKDYDARHKDATYVLSEIKNQVLTVYDSIGCKSMGNVGVLHSSHGITDGNLMQYLGVIEQRTNEILQMYYATVQSHGSDVGGKQGIAADHSTPRHHGRTLAVRAQDTPAGRARAPRRRTWARLPCAQPP